MAISEERKKKLNKQIAEFKKDHDLTEDTSVKIGILSEDESLGVVTKIPTGNIAFDILSDGGMIEGKINELYGGESSGKTTLIADMIAYNQKNKDNWLPAYLNNEKTLDKEYFKLRGVVEDEILIGEFKTTEQSADFCNSVVKDGIADFLAIDTLQAISPESELMKKGEVKSVSANSMALIPRVYSQFLRMYTSLTQGKLTLLLGSQVRLDLGAFIPSAKQTGGKAIDHYSVLTIGMARSDSKSNWPTTEMPPNSFSVTFKIDKSKMMNRFKGNKIKGYFYNGSFDRKYNIIAIGSEYDVHNKKTWNGINYRGIDDMYNKISDEDLELMRLELSPAYSKNLNGETEE